MKSPNRHDDVREQSRLTKEEWREYTKTVWHIANVTDSRHPAVFPLEIPHRLIKMFSFVDDTVLDPFGGTGTTGVAALRLGRQAVMVDQKAAYTRAAQTSSKAEASEDRFVARTGDSRDMSWLHDESVGLVVTSPPYWNKVAYGRKRENLGNQQNYSEFIDSLGPVFRECYRVLQPGRKVCVVTANVNQFTDHGLLTFPLAPDIAVLLRELGFVMINEIIWNKDGTGGRWGSWGRQRPIFGSYPYPPNFLFKTVHEYILVFAKPDSTRRRSPKAIPLSKLLKSSMNGASARKNGRRRHDEK